MTRMTMMITMMPMFISDPSYDDEEDDDDDAFLDHQPKLEIGSPGKTFFKQKLFCKNY